MAGSVGQFAIAVQATVGVKNAVTTVTQLRASGKSWGEIASDPAVIAQLASAIAGVAGVGSNAVPELREFFHQAGLVATAAQLSGLATAVVTIETDETLSADDRNEKLLSLSTEFVLTALTTTEGYFQLGSGRKDI